ncbi:DUF1987 domain-containing protein [Roseospirillum parvum]|nr:DUF1987 domain-containing protein [Roseospirillum parvum]
MPVISQQATERSPEVEFDPSGGRLSLRGESYPEDAAGFFGPLLGALREHLDGTDPENRIEVDIELSYFNSSSAKALMNMFQLLEEAAAAGRSVHIAWRYHADDDTMAEFGEDFSEDFEHAAFTLCPSED